MQVYRSETSIKENQGKSPTAVLVDPSRAKKVLAVGLDALKMWQCNEEVAQNSRTANTSLLFENFMVGLKGSSPTYRVSPRDGWSPTTSAGATPKKVFPLLLPVARLLEGIKITACRHLNGADSTFQPEFIRWVLTVPAIWSKAFMRKAAETAGLVHPDGTDADRLALVLESEAAAISALVSMEPAEAARVREGTKLMNLDCGDDKIDITSSVVRRLEVPDIELEQLQPPGGGPWGATDVDQHFRAFLEAHLLQGRKIHFSDWLVLKQQWLPCKEDWDHRNPDLVVVDVNQLVHVQGVDGGALFTDAYLQLVNARFLSIPALATCRVERVGRSRILNIHLNNTTMRGFFVHSVAETVKEAKRMLANAADTELVLVVGDYAQSQLFFDRLCAELTTPGRRVFRPAEAWKAVVRGAALFGLSPLVLSCWREREATRDRRARDVAGAATSGSPAYAPAPSESGVDPQDWYVQPAAPPYTPVRTALARQPASDASSQQRGLARAASAAAAPRF